jgi:hypothetical protein
MKTSVANATKLHAAAVLQRDIAKLKEKQTRLTLKRDRLKQKTSLSKISREVEDDEFDSVAEDGPMREVEADVALVVQELADNQRDLEAKAKEQEELKHEAGKQVMADEDNSEEGEHEVGKQDVAEEEEEAFADSEERVDENRPARINALKLDLVGHAIALMTNGKNFETDLSALMKSAKALKKQVEEGNEEEEGEDNTSKRKLGRPKGSKKLVTQSEDEGNEEEEREDNTPKRKRGRPKGSKKESNSVQTPNRPKRPHYPEKIASSLSTLNTASISPSYKAKQITPSCPSQLLAQMNSVFGSG